MIPVEEARRIVYERVGTPLPPRWAPLPELLGRVLAEDLVASTDIPAFANSAMDGYAVRAADVARTGARLRVIGEIPAGTAWTGAALAPGEALRIMTGAPLPPGADAVVMVEDSQEQDGVVTVAAVVQAGDHVRPPGDDVLAGTLVLRCHEVLTPARIGMMAALGLAGAVVVPRARVAIVCTGAELVDPLASASTSARRGPGAACPVSDLGPGQIWNSNAHGLYAQILACGALPVPLDVCPDDLDQTVVRLRAALTQADVVLTSGGVSLGRHDHVGQALAELGEVLFTSVAQQPGKPLTFAMVGGKPVFGLPGNPVSTALNFEIFARPAILRLMGHRDGERPHVRVRLAEPLSGTPGKTCYVRARLDGDVARPTGPQGSARWQSLADAEALLLVPANAGELPAGAQIEAIRLSPLDGAGGPAAASTEPLAAGVDPLADGAAPIAVEAGALTHFDAAGRARMVDVSGKPQTLREAVAAAVVRMRPETLAMIRAGRHAKGDVLAVAQVAGIMGAKRTADWIPMCHPLGLDSAELAFELDSAASCVRITARVRTTGRTGVEMEALSAVSAAALTVYDMCKAVDRGMTVTEIGLLEKRGGKSGVWQRGSDEPPRAGTRRVPDSLGDPDGAGDLDGELRVGLLTVSDAGAAGQREDRSGAVLADMLAAASDRQFTVARRDLLPDDAASITATLCRWCDDDRLDLILTTGGTGLGPRDVTPEATARAIAFEVPGMAEAMRAGSLAKTPMAMLSRALVGVRGRTLIANLPGSPKGARECLEILLPALTHSLEVLRGRGTDHALHGHG